MIPYIIFFFLGIIGVLVGYGLGKKAGFAEGWKCCWIVFESKIQQIKQELYEEGKKSDNSRSSRNYPQS